MMIRTSLSAFLIIAFISCNTTDWEPPLRSDFKVFAEDPYITGKITHIDLKSTGGDSLLVVLIEENLSVNEPLESGGKKIRLTIWNETNVFALNKNGNAYHYKKDKLKVGQIVSGWLTNGIVLDSYPQQGAAKQILVIEK